MSLRFDGNALLTVGEQPTDYHCLSHYVLFYVETLQLCFDLLRFI